ncbi:MAG: RNA-binding S4 domain-containing protein [Rhodospirillales bacterium]|jgi:ribosome-associated heat shock protein Hsp15
MQDGRPEPPSQLRIDKWLWYARFFKSRSLAAKQCNDKRIRINGEAGVKAHHLIKAGDVLTFPKGPHIRVIKIIALATRRGPAPEAQALYEDLEPPVSRKQKQSSQVAARDPGAGRPTKADRRAIDRLKSDL